MIIPRHTKVKMRMCTGHPLWSWYREYVNEWYRKGVNAEWGESWLIRDLACVPATDWLVQSKEGVTTYYRNRAYTYVTVNGKELGMDILNRDLNKMRA